LQLRFINLFSIKLAVESARAETGQLRRGNVEKKNKWEEGHHRKAEMKEEKQKLHRNFLSMISEYRDRIFSHPLRESGPVMGHQIAVCIRTRPFCNTDMVRNEVNVIPCPWWNIRDLIARRRCHRW
jgi:hypothetical protein